MKNSNLFTYFTGVIPPLEVSPQRHSCSAGHSMTTRRTTTITTSTTTDSDNIVDILNMSELDIDSLSNSEAFSKDETTSDPTIATENTISLTSPRSGESPTLDVSVEITEEVGDSSTTPQPTTLPSLNNSFDSFLFPDRGNFEKVSDPQIPSVEDPFNDPDPFTPGSVQDPLTQTQDPTLNVSHGLGEGEANSVNKAEGAELVFSDNSSVTGLEINNLTTENMDNLELELKNIGEPIESNDLSTEVVEDISDSSENTRESRLLENPTRKTISKSDGEIHFEKIYRGSSDTFTYSIILNVIVFSINVILLM